MLVGHIEGVLLTFLIPQYGPNREAVCSFRHMFVVVDDSQLRSWIVDFGAWFSEKARSFSGTRPGDRDNAT